MKTAHLSGLAFRGTVSYLASRADFFPPPPPPTTRPWSSLPPALRHPPTVVVQKSPLWAKLPKTLRGQDPTKRAAIDVPTLAAAGSDDEKNSRRRKRRFSTTPRSYVQTTEATYQPNSKNPRSLLFTRSTILFTTSMRYSGGRLCDSTSV